MMLFQPLLATGDVGFPYIAQRNAKVLILGSMPGRKSLAKQQYYGHAQNSFWPIMGALFGFSAELDYEQRLTMLRQHHIALWDVAQQCVRPGSLDQAIAMHSVVSNDFSTFFAEHVDVSAIFFNGQKAAQLYRQRVKGLQPLPMFVLPSTSPAHASMRREEKLAHWGLIKKILIKQTGVSPLSQKISCKRLK